MSEEKVNHPLHAALNVKLAEIAAASPPTAAIGSLFGGQSAEDVARCA